MVDGQDKLLLVKEVKYNSNGRSILNDISFSIETGQVIAVIGPSGSGKSTLLFLLNRLYEPTAGEILYRGRPLPDYPVIEIRRKIGLVMQMPYLFSGTLRDNICYGPTLAGLECSEQIEKYMLYAGLSKELLDRDVGHLSGGEKQRAAFARTLANEPEILLLDEPTSALDSLSREIIESSVEGLRKDRGLAVIWVTHSLAQAGRIADKILAVKSGAVTFFGDARDLPTEGVPIDD